MQGLATILSLFAGVIAVAVIIGVAAAAKLAGI